MMLQRVTGSPALCLAIAFAILAGALPRASAEPPRVPGTSSGWGNTAPAAGAAHGGRPSAPAVSSYTRLPPAPSPVPVAPVAPGVQPASAAPGAAAPGDDPVIELTRARSELQKAYDSINAVNPLSASYGKSANGAAIPPAPSAGPLSDLYRLMNNPAVQGYLKLFSNPTFYQGVEQIMNHPRRMELLYAEAAFFLFMLFFRAWRMSKCVKWYQKVWTYTWTWISYWVLSVTVIPYALLGEAYYRVVSGAVGVWFTAK